MLFPGGFWTSTRNTPRNLINHRRNVYNQPGKATTTTSTPHNNSTGRRIRHCRQKRCSQTTSTSTNAANIRRTTHKRSTFRSTAGNTYSRMSNCPSKRYNQHKYASSIRIKRIGQRRYKTVCVNNCFFLQQKPLLIINRSVYNKNKMLFA